MTTFAAVYRDRGVTSDRRSLDTWLRVVHGRRLWRKLVFWPAGRRLSGRWVG